MAKTYTNLLFSRENYAYPKILPSHWIEPIASKYQKHQNTQNIQTNKARSPNYTHQNSFRYNYNPIFSSNLGPEERGGLHLQIDRKSICHLIAFDILRIYS